MRRFAATLLIAAAHLGATTIQQQIVRPDGSNWAGQVTLQLLNAGLDGNGNYSVASTTNVQVTAGAFSRNLTPGTYKVSYAPAARGATQWVVPTTGGPYSISTAENGTPSAQTILIQPGQISPCPEGSVIGTASGATITSCLAPGPPPAIASGFGTSPAIAGADPAGRITVGTGGTATTGTITFATAYATAPACTANNETSIQLLKATATASTLSITASTPFGAADKLTWLCTRH